MTIHKGGVVSANHGNDELYTTEELSKFVANVYKNDLKKYDTILMPFNSKGSKLEKELKKIHENVIAFDTDFFTQDFSEYKNAVIFDNPPFSIFGKVLARTNELGFDFYLFGNAMSMFHHLRKSYVTGINQIGSVKFDNAEKKVNVSIFTNTNYEIKNDFYKRIKPKKIELTPHELYSSGKIVTRLENGQTFDSRNFKNYSNKPFGGGMTYEP